MAEVGRVFVSRWNPMQAILMSQTPEDLVARGYSSTMTNENKSARRRNIIGVMMMIGIIVGIALGSAFANVGIGIALGTGIGLMSGAALSARQR